MNTKQLLDEIMRLLKTVQNNNDALGKIHEFMLDEIYEEPEDEKIPEKYKKLVISIADSLTAGFVCYFNPDTFEVEDVPELLINDPDEFEAMTGESYESMNIKNQNWEHRIEIEPLQSHDSYKIMERFVVELDDEKFQNRLERTLSNRKPFANFKHLIDNSDFRQNWFDFRQKLMEQYVWQQIQYKIEGD